MNTDGNMYEMNRRLDEDEARDRYEELLAAEERVPELEERIEELEAKLADAVRLVVRGQDLLDPCYPLKHLFWQNDAKALVRANRDVQGSRLIAAPEAANRIEALEAENRDLALQMLASDGQAQEAYEAKKDAEAKLAKAVAALDHEVRRSRRHLAKSTLDTLAELKGQDND